MGHASGCPDPHGLRLPHCGARTSASDIAEALGGHAAQGHQAVTPGPTGWAVCASAGLAYALVIHAMRISYAAGRGGRLHQRSGIVLATVTSLLVFHERTVAQPAVAAGVVCAGWPASGRAGAVVDRRPAQPWSWQPRAAPGQPCASPRRHTVALA